MQIQNLRAILIKMLLGALIAAAAIAVVAVLVGNVNDVLWRAIGTLFSAIVHIVLLFGVVSIAAPGANGPNVRSTNLVINASMVIAVLSFFIKPVKNKNTGCKNINNAL